jgi:predicted DNA-binding protein (MmcQ/YjbR family)
MSARHAGYRVRGRTFAYYLVDHRGNEGIEGLVCKVRPGENDSLIDSDPGRFYRPAYMHHHGWVGLRLDRPSVNWTEVEDMAVESYLLVAPKRLAASVRDTS